MKNSENNGATFHISCGLGLTFGVIVTLAIVDPDLSTLGGKIKLADWLAFSGALIGAAVTVLAAILATRLQFKKQEQEAAERRRRDLQAAKAILANDLSSIMDYIEDCVRISTIIINDLMLGASPRHDIANPALPTEILIRLGNLVSLAEPDDANAIANLMSDIQLLKARLSGQVNQFMGRGDPHLIQCSDSLRIALKSAVDVYVHCASSFEYARRRSDRISPPDYSNKMIQSAFWELKIDSIPDKTLLTSLRNGLAVEQTNPA